MKTFLAKRIHDPRGTLSAVEESELPFKIRRVYYLYDIPGGESQRGAHAHWKCHRVMFALSGSFTAVMESVYGITVSVMLNKPWEGVEIPPQTWLTLKDFSSGAVALVLASNEYSEADYIRSRELWERMVTQAMLMEKP